MTQKSFTEGLRHCCSTPRQSRTATPSREHTAPPTRRLERLNDLLLPIVKGYGSERFWSCLEQNHCRPSAARFPCRLSDRAVRSRCQDRHPLRGHDRHSEPGPVLPQDRPRIRVARLVIFRHRSASGLPPRREWRWEEERVRAAAGIGRCRCHRGNHDQRSWFGDPGTAQDSDPRQSTKSA